MDLTELNQLDDHFYKEGSLHDYIKWYLPKAEKCAKCKLKKKLDLANISQEYRRDLDDWEWLCRRCHMIKDGRMKNLNHSKET